ncbi:MAG: DUF1559 domain-containing protein [Planctomycetales bacterium]
MTHRQALASWGSFVVLLAAFLLGPILFGQEKRSPAPEKLLPAEALLYVGWDGSEAHQDAWKKTAAYDALIQSGLGGLVVKLSALAEREVGPEPVRMVMTSLEHLSRQGLYLAAAAPSVEQGPPLPQLTVVVPKAGGAIGQINALLDQSGVRDFHTQMVDGRKVTRGRLPELPAAEIGWWAEGSHLVIAVGVGAVDSALEVAQGKSPNITQNPVWKKYQSRAEFEQALVAWIDLGTIRQRVSGFPIPGPNPNQPTTVDEVLKTLGLDQIGPLACRWGFRGEALWSETTLEAPGPHTGVLEFADQKPLSLSELPPLPAGTDGFYAGRHDWSKTAQGMLRIGTALMQRFGPPGSPTGDQFLAHLKQVSGLDLQKDLLDPLGDVMVLYGDSRQGLFGMGIGLAISVDDAAKARASFDKLLAHLAQAAGPDMRVKTSQRGEGTIKTLEFPELPVISPALTVSDKWLVIGLYPQTVDSFLMRQAGKLPAWEPTDTVKQALADLPKSYTSFTYSDPREGLRATLGVAPMLISLVQMDMARSRPQPLPGRSMPESPVSLADFPPSELVTRTLFENVSVCSVTKAEIRWTSRTSVPSVPLLGGAGISSGGAAVPVLVALLLPAVQQAREAARRTQSMNNLKQIALALHNYHDTYQAFPAGTHQNDKLKADKRLSWQADILPYIDQAAVFNQIDFKKSWEDEVNARMVAVQVPVLLNPGVAAPRNPQYASTHYVGLAGIGNDAYTLPVRDKRAGVFGYNRVTRIQDILDGTSNTIGVTEASKDYGPWSAGGPSTIRALTKKPYINGPDGLGGPFRGGMNVMMMDGSVRFVSENIDPNVLEALTTIAGGEAVGNF